MTRLQINGQPLDLQCRNNVSIDLQLKFKTPIQNTDTPCLEASTTIIGTLVSSDPSVVINNPIVYNSNNNFDVWLPISAEIVGPVNIIGVDLFLEFTGLIDCCSYQAFIKGVDSQINPTFNCVEENPDVIIIPKIGFGGTGGGGSGSGGFGDTLGDDELGGIQRVIDNKKSWVYNPGLVKDGIKPTDDIIRRGGERGLIDGYGKLNRKFSPSEDANLPYRQTNYKEQSSVLEKHSDLVINSKEMFLTFNMKPLDTFCPNGYTILSGNTCSNGLRNQEALNVTLLNLEEYKKTFQSFWVKMTEQFIPATTIFVSGEKWSNRPEDICNTLEECDLTNELTSAEVTVTDPNGDIIITLSETDDIITGSAAEIPQTLVNVGVTQLTQASVIENTNTNKTIDLPSISLRVLNEDILNTKIISEPLIFNRVESNIRKVNMDIYRSKLANISEIIVIE